jgi:hypothetical protein
MKKLVQHIIIIVALAGFANASSFAQDCSKQDKIVKATIILVDSVELEHIYIDGTIHPMYKFKMEKLYHGEYSCEFIYVTLYPGSNMIYQFNPLKNTGVRYWWGMINTGDLHDNIPVYKHSSCF